jgi:phosphatidylserine/phosphatidylglycerophosphate/cardiolipin synthase-like enzyme
MTLTILNRTEYFEALARGIAKTKQGDRVALTAMVFDTQEPIIARIADGIAAAAARGVTAYLGIDAREFLTNEDTKFPGPLWYHRTLPDHLREPFRSHRDKLDKLTASGVHVAIINKPEHRFSLMQAGRSHIKAAVINNRLYVGGCNLEKPDFIDGMLSWQDHSSADWLFGRLRSVVETGRSRIAFHDTDERHVVDGKTEILLDAGKPGQSLILERTLQFLDQAKEWIFFTCQFVPHGVIADHLVQAKRRGVDVTVLFNHPSKHDTYEGLLQRGAKLHERLRLPADYFQGELPKATPFLHGKVLATEQGLVMGSHNFVYTGVRLGTAEMAVLSRDPILARRAADSIKQQIGQPS